MHIPYCHDYPGGEVFPFLSISLILFFDRKTLCPAFKLRLYPFLGFGTWKRATSFTWGGFPLIFLEILSLMDMHLFFDFNLFGHFKRSNIYSNKGFIILLIKLFELFSDFWIGDNHKSFPPSLCYFPAVTYFTMGHGAFWDFLIVYINLDDKQHPPISGSMYRTIGVRHFQFHDGYLFLWQHRGNFIVPRFLGFIDRLGLINMTGWPQIPG